MKRIPFGGLIDPFRGISSRVVYSSGCTSRTPTAGEVGEEEEKHNKMTMIA